VGVADHELNPAQTALFERDQEFAPEALAVADLETQQLTTAVSVHAQGHQHSPGADL